MWQGLLFGICFTIHLRGRANRALRVLARSDGVEEFPVWFAGVEECSDPVVGEASETEGNPFDAFGSSSRIRGE